VVVGAAAQSIEGVTQQPKKTGKERTLGIRPPMNASASHESPSAEGNLLKHHLRRRGSGTAFGASSEYEPSNEPQAEKGLLRMRSCHKDRRGSENDSLAKLS